MDEPPLLVYDGVCVLCNTVVRWLLRLDRRGRLRVAPFQGETARLYGLTTMAPASLAYVERPGGALATESEAVLRALATIGQPWRTLVGPLRLVPRAWRDAVYRWIARNRYRWFGRYDACPLPPERWQARWFP